MAIIILPFFVGYFYFTYFNAIPETMVPDVIGLSKNEAVSRIENMGLKIKITEMDKEPKLVTNQRPEPGKIVKSGRIISVTIGSPVEISIPSPISVSEELNNEETGSND
ncbi:hypothetical protein A2310_04560 [candidate division WOR-1 bacterium RIFOXYB2_FULL_37_13]|uniref:PASTA domain-containing protein n=1 Tax=candidate division WOR-1 bacterium RIFOXYB2_FULL_37_13 TaxID=1802579 RepID=A0A1F4SWB0_UNCSA|nr:MAG: hypothetical protein A2310_04560 [candidate division WOR-1 bacterium RIFOXYB2_FULL_37_13]